MMTGLTLMNYRRILLRSITAAWQILLRVGASQTVDALILTHRMIM